MTVAEGFSKQERNQTFHEDVAALVLSNNVPFTRFDSLFPDSFISAIVARKEPALLSSSSYRKSYAVSSFLRWRTDLITSNLTNVPYSLIVDESGKNNRKVVNSIAVTGKNTFLVDTRVFDGDVSITHLVIRDYIVKMMEECNLQRDKLVGITRDNAAYMIKAIDVLKEEEGFGHILNVGCLSHGLSLVINDLLDPFQSLRDHLFASLKKSFSKPSAMRTRAAKKLKGFVNAVQVSQTRWGDWLHAISFVYSNIDAIKVMVTFIIFPFFSSLIFLNFSKRNLFFFSLFQHILTIFLFSIFQSFYIIIFLFYYS